MVITAGNVTNILVNGSVANATEVNANFKDVYPTFTANIGLVNNASSGAITGYFINPIDAKLKSLGQSSWTSQNNVAQWEFPKGTVLASGTYLPAGSTAICYHLDANLGNLYCQISFVISGAN